MIRARAIGLAVALASLAGCQREPPRELASEPVTLGDDRFLEIQLAPDAELQRVEPLGVDVLERT